MEIEKMTRKAQYKSLEMLKDESNFKIFDAILELMKKICNVQQTGEDDSSLQKEYRSILNQHFDSDYEMKVCLEDYIVLKKKRAIGFCESKCGLCCRKCKHYMDDYLDNASLFNLHNCQKNELDVEYPYSSSCDFFELKDEQ